MNIFTLLYFAETFLRANSVDPDQLPPFAATELRLFCLRMPQNRISGSSGVDYDKISNVIIGKG